MSTTEQVFRAFEHAACNGKRCPTEFDLPNNGPHARQLAREGRILIEISGHNWRTVTILTGPHAGKKTKPDPRGNRIYRVIGIDDRINGEVRQPVTRAWR